MLGKKLVSLDHSVLLGASKAKALVTRAVNEGRVAVGLYKILDKIADECLCGRITCCKAPAAGDIHIGKVGALIEHNVLAGDDAGSKLTKAQNLGVKIIDEYQLIAMLGL